MTTGISLLVCENGGIDIYSGLGYTGDVVLLSEDSGKLQVCSRSSERVWDVFCASEVQNAITGLDWLEA